MRNKTKILKMAQEVNNFEKDLNKEEVQALYELIKKSDNKETNKDYEELMIQAKNAEDVYDKLHYINMALGRVGIHVFQL